MPPDVTLNLSREDATILMLFLRTEAENFDHEAYRLDALFPDEEEVDTGEKMNNCLQAVMNSLRASLKYRKEITSDPQRG